MFEAEVTYISSVFGLTRQRELGGSCGDHFSRNGFDGSITSFVLLRSIDYSYWEPLLLCTDDDGILSTKPTARNGKVGSDMLHRHNVTGPDPTAVNKGAGKKRLLDAMRTMLMQATRREKKGKKKLFLLVSAGPPTNRLLSAALIYRIADLPRHLM